MTDLIEKRLKEILQVIELKVRTYLDVCEHPLEKMFLLNYFNCILDSITAGWFSFKFDESSKPSFQYPGNEDFGEFVPEHIKWFEPNNIKARKAIEPHLLELFPQFNINDDSGQLIHIIDFALFCPRTDGIPVKIKIAIECVTTPLENLTLGQVYDLKKAYSFLKSRGWIIARFTGNEILKEDIYSLINEVERLVLEKDEELFNQSERNKGRWHLN